MKKTIPPGEPCSLPKRSLFKLYLGMKMTVALVLLTAFQVFAGNGNAQVVTLQMKQAEMPKVFKAIENKDNYRFLYNFDLPALQKKIDVDVKNTAVVSVLNELLSGTGLSYKIMNGELVVIVSSMDEASASRKITGTVVSDKGVAIEGVSVRVKGTNFGTVTDSKGSFSLEVPEKAVLVFLR